MKERFLNISNHALTPAQIEEIKGHDLEILELTDDLKKAWGSMNPANWKETCEAIMEFVIHNNVQVALVAGYTPAVYDITFNFDRQVREALYAHTDRVSVEKTNEDGAVVKTNVFKHTGFYNIISGERW